MTLEEMLKDEYKSGKAEGKAEAILLLLKRMGEVPTELSAQILSENSK